MHIQRFTVFRHMFIIHPYKRKESIESIYKNYFRRVFERV